MFGGNGDADNRDLAMFLDGANGADGFLDGVSRVSADRARPQVLRGDDDQVKLFNAASLNEIVKVGRLERFPPVQKQLSGQIGAPRPCHRLPDITQLMRFPSQ